MRNGNKEWEWEMENDNENIIWSEKYFYSLKIVSETRTWQFLSKSPFTRLDFPFYRNFYPTCKKGNVPIS